MKFSFILPLLLSFLLSACATSSGEAPLGCDDDGSNCRPFRSGILKFDDELDAEKPVSAIDEAGWALATSVIIGAYKDGWIAAYDMRKRS